MVAEFQKLGYNVFRSYDDVGIDFIKLAVQSYLKCLITVIVEDTNLQMLCCIMQIIIQNHCPLKVKKGKTK